MKENTLIVSFPNKKIVNLFPEGKVIYWLYLGKDFLKMNTLDRHLGSNFRRLNIVALQEEVAGDIRQRHVQWIDELNRCYGQDLEWWFGAVSSRNIHLSNLFQYCCYLEILKRLWVGEKQKPDLVVVESLALAKIIKKWVEEMNLKPIIAGYLPATFRPLIHYLINFFRWLRFTAVLFLRRLAAISSRIICHPKKILPDTSVIVSTYVHDDCLTKEGVFKDRYFPSLYEYLWRYNINVIVHPIFSGFHFNYFSIYKRIRKSKTIFIIPEDYLKFSDYLHVLTYPLRALRRKFKKTYFLGFELSGLLKEEHFRESVISGLQCVFVYRLILRLGMAKVNPERIILWHENQIIDKALIAGARRAFPQTRIIGTQQFTLYPNSLSFFCSQAEVEAKITPQLLLGMSREQCESAHLFTKDIICRPVSALRYAHLFNEKSHKSSINRLDKSILVLLPFKISEAQELLITFNEALAQMDEKPKVFIRCHPDYDNLRQLVLNKHHYQVRFELFRGELRSAINMVSMVVSSTSNSTVEAAVMGTPVIFLGRQSTLSLNPLSEFKLPLISECYSAQDLKSAIKKYLYLSDAEKMSYKEMGLKMRDFFFSPVNDETLSPFLAD